MAKGFPHVALGYGLNGNRSSTPGQPITGIKSGQDLVKDIRSGKGLGK